MVQNYFDVEPITPNINYQKNKKWAAKEFFSLPPL
jgi:hypothetical protein